MMRSRPPASERLSPAGSDPLPSLLIELGNRAFSHFGAVATGLGLPPPVAMALRWIEPARPGPMHELAGAMECDPSYVTWIADQLEKRGLAARQVSSHDRRVKVLALTPDGVALRAELLERFARFPLAIDQLSAGEAAMLGELLARVLGDESATSECAAVEPAVAAVRRSPAKRRGVVAKG